MSTKRVTWEYFIDEAGRALRRVEVPGGWLYQVQADTDCGVPTWGLPVFVPDRLWDHK